MKIHTSLTSDQLYAATSAAGPRVRMVDVTAHGSRSRPRAFDFRLIGTSTRRPAFGAGEDGEYAATWDEWGMVLARLFELDPDMTCAGAYLSAADFSYKTDGRFEMLTPAYQHPAHRWEPSDVPREQECDCGATRRF